MIVPDPLPVVNMSIGQTAVSGIPEKPGANGNFGIPGKL